MIFDAMLLIIAKVGLVFITAMISIRWIAVPYLWLKYDRHIQRLNDEFVEFKKREIESAGGRGIVQSHLDRIINIKEKKISEQVNILEIKRSHFLDRINLIATVSSLGK